AHADTRPAPAASELHVTDTGSSGGLRANFALMESHGHVSARHRGRLLAGPMTGSRGPPSNPRRCCGVLGRPVKASTSAQPGDDICELATLLLNLSRPASWDNDPCPVRPQR